MLYPLLLGGVAIALVATAVCGLSRRRSTAMPTPAAVFLLAVAGWSAAYALELLHVELAAKLFWSKLQYIGIVVVPLAWLVYAFHLAGRRGEASKRLLSALTVVPLVTLLLVFTNDGHSLMWRAATLRHEGSFVILDKTMGWGFGLFMAFAYLLFLLGLFMVFQALLQSYPLYRWQLGTLFIAAVITWLTSVVVDVYGFTPLPHLDLTPLVLGGVSLLLAWSPLHPRLGDIVPLARSNVIKGIADGVVVLDARERVVDINPAACSLIGWEAARAIGCLAEELWRDQPVLLEWLRDRLTDGGEVKLTGEHGLRTCDVRISPLTDWRGALVGQVVVLRDITDLQRRADELSIVLEAIRAVSSTLDLEEVLSLIAERLMHAMDVDGCTLSRWDREEDTVVTWVERRRVRSAAAEAPATIYALDDFPATRRVLEAGQPLAIRVGNPDADPAEVALLRQLGCASMLMLPLAVGGRAMGLVELDDRREREFAVSDIRLCQALADQAAVAIENARLFEEARRQAAELAALNKTGQALTSTLDLDVVLTMAIAEATSLLHAEGATVLLHDTATSELFFAACVGPGAEALLGRRMRASAGIAGWVLREGKPALIRDARSDPRFYQNIDAVTGLTTRSLLAVPLRYRDRVIGVIEVINTASGSFSEHDLDLLNTLAGSTAVAIENARLYEQNFRRLEELNTLLQVEQTIASSLDLREVLDTICRNATRLIRGTSAYVCRWDEQRRQAEVVAEYFSSEASPRERLSDLGCVYEEHPTFANRLMQGQPFVMHVSDADLPTGWREYLQEYDGKSVAIIPLIARGHIFAYLEIWDTLRERAFSEDDLLLGLNLAGQAATAIENARLYEETLRRLAEARVLKEVMLAAASTLDFDQVLQRTLETLQSAMQVEFLSFALPDADGTALRIHPSCIGYPPEAGSIRLPLDASICGRVFQTGEPIAAGNVRAVPYYCCANPAVRSELAVPVRFGGQVIAVLDVESVQLNAFDEDDMAFYAAIAGQLGVALENAWLYQQVSRQADDLAAAVARLEELDRLKNELIQNISHELRTPLALVRGYAAMLAAGEFGTLQPAQQRPLDIVTRRARMLSDLVEDITLVLEVEAHPPEPEPVAFDELARLAVDDFRIAADKAELTLTVDIPADLPSVGSSPLHLRRVLDNLLMNAIKFTPAGGEVAVRMWQQDGYVLLRVSDTGIGIPADKLTRIFDRFYQVDGSLKRRYGGVGLGLALVREIVEAYGGSVTVESELGCGTVFIVSLPVAQPC